MDLDDAERTLRNLPPDHPLAPAVRALFDDRDAARRLCESLADRCHKQSELLSASAERRAGRPQAGSGV